MFVFLALEKGYIRETELDAFFDHLLVQSGTEVSTHNSERSSMCLSAKYKYQSLLLI